MPGSCDATKQGHECKNTPKCDEAWAKSMFITEISRMAKDAGVRVKTDCFNYIHLYITELGKEK